MAYEIKICPKCGSGDIQFTFSSYSNVRRTGFNCYCTKCLFTTKNQKDREEALKEWNEWKQGDGEYYELPITGVARVAITTFSKNHRKG